MSKVRILISVILLTIVNYQFFLAEKFLRKSVEFEKKIKVLMCFNMYFWFFTIFSISILIFIGNEVMKRFLKTKEKTEEGKLKVDLYHRLMYLFFEDNLYLISALLTAFLIWFAV